MKNIKGLVNYNIDIVIKVGGSLLNKDKNFIQNVIENLKELKKVQNIILFPGGGPTDNTMQ